MKRSSYCLLAVLLHSSYFPQICLSLSLNGNNVDRRAVLASAAAAPSLLLHNPSPAYAESSISSPSASVPSILLNPKSCASTESPNKPFPLASFGLQIYDNDTAYKLTLTALEAGYRNFFASVLAGNQKGFARAIKDSAIPLSELYICGTVLSNRNQGYKNAFAKTKKGCEENLAVMSQYGGIDKLDMIMLDYPGPDSESILGQWNAFEEFQKEDKATHLALSNFNARQLDAVMNNPDTCAPPTVNQLPYSIANHPRPLMEENEKRGIHVQSWSPLSSTLPKYRKEMEAVGSRYGKSAAQVGLRWIVQSGGSYCVQSKKASHFNEDLNVFDFTLSDRDMDLLSSLEPPRSF